MCVHPLAKARLRFRRGLEKHFHRANIFTEGLPPGSVATELTAWGMSAWTRTQRVVIRHPDGNTKAYFLKSCSEDVAAVMMKGEFTSLCTIYDIFPDRVPKPFGWGELKSTPGTYFVLMDFLQLDSSLPDPAEFAQVVTDLHKGGTSPNGKFGFSIPNCHGKKVQEHYWDDNWCRYFTNLITAFFDEEIRINGPYPEFERAFGILRQHVIPRLLEPLQAEGRTLTPSLVHGDLWQENVGTNLETGEIMVYDPAVWYAHHEYEFGMWRCAFNTFDETYIWECLRRLPASAPDGEFEDRNRLYSLKFHISHSFHWPEATDDTRRRYGLPFRAHPAPQGYMVVVC